METVVRIPDPIKSVNLKINPVDPNLTSEELKDIGINRIKLEGFLNRSSDGEKLPFALTHDGIDVYFGGQLDHFFGKDELKKSNSEIERDRIERLHWIAPIISGRTKLIGLHEMNNGRYRNYYAVKLNYLVVLERTGKGYSLITAYRTNWKGVQEKMQRIFNGLF